MDDRLDSFTNAASRIDVIGRHVESPGTAASRTAV